MSSIMDDLEKKFFNLPHDEDCQELVRLLTLDDDVIKAFFKNDENIRNRYLPNEKCQAITKQLEELETEPSEEENISEEQQTKHHVKMDKESWANRPSYPTTSNRPRGTYGTE